MSAVNRKYDMDTIKATITQLLEESDTISPTQYDMEAKYRFFNATLFNNQLPPVKLGWKSMKGKAGEVTGMAVPAPEARTAAVYSKRKSVRLGAKVVKWDTVSLTLDSRFRRTEDAFDGLIVHEMLHLYFWLHNKLAENHGPEFMSKLQELQAKVPFNIPVSENSVDKEVDGEVPLREVSVMILEKRDGTYAFKLATTKAGQHPGLREYWDAVMKYAPHINVVRLFTVKNAAWSKVVLRWPVARTMDAKSATYSLPPELSEELLSSLSPMNMVFEINRGIQEAAPVKQWRHHSPAQMTSLADIVQYADEMGVELNADEEYETITVYWIGRNKKLRRKGAGRMVMMFLCDYADATNKYINLGILEQTRTAFNKLLQFYEALGFDVTEESDPNNETGDGYEVLMGRSPNN